MDGVTICSAQISAVEAQQLTIRILTILPLSVSRRIVDKLLGDANSLSPDTISQLRLCLGISSELREDPKCYDSPEKLFEAVLRQQTSRESIRKKEYGSAMGINEKQRMRLISGKAKLTLEHIRKLCSGFSDPVARRFWENLLLKQHPEIADLGRGDGPEAAALEELSGLLTWDEYDAALKRLDDWERRCLEEIAEPDEPDLGKFGKEPDRLYSVLKALAHGNGIVIAGLADEIGITSNTWFFWKDRWERAEREGFQNGIPKTRLRRGHMLLLSVFLKLNYPQSVYLLALAGYRFIPGEPDDSIARYLKSPTSSSAELCGYIREGLNTGRW